MKLGNVIYGDELVKHIAASYINYIDDVADYNAVNKELPTLFVGWRFMKENNQHIKQIKKADILDKTIKEKRLYWEFSFDENKSEHVNGVQDFVDAVPSLYYDSMFDYICIDPVFDKIKTFNDLTSKLPDVIDTCYVFKDQAIYIKQGNVIYGIDLNMFGFFGFDTTKIVDIITNKTFLSKTHLDSDGEMHKKMLRTFPNFHHLKRYMCDILEK